MTASRCTVRKRKREELREEVEKSSSFLRKWMKPSPGPPSKKDKNEKDSNQPQKSDTEKESSEKNEEKNMSVRQKIEMFEPKKKDETKKKRPRKFKDDRSWIGTRPEMGCDKIKDCSRNTKEFKGSKETEKKRESDEGDNPKQSLGLWDGWGGKSGLVDGRKNVFGTKLRSLTRKGERESKGDSEILKPQPTLKPIVRKKKILDNDYGTPKGFLEGHCGVIGQGLEDKIKWTNDDTDSRPAHFEKE